MSRTATSIELVEHPQTPLPSTPSLPASIFIKENRTLSQDDDLQPITAASNTVDVEQLQAPGKRTTAVVLVTVVCVTGISSMLSGVTAVALPSMATDLQLAPNVLLWYCSVTFTTLRHR